MLSSLLSFDLESSPSTLVAINHVAPMRMMALRMPMTTQSTVLLRRGGWLKEPEGGTVPGLEGGTVPLLTMRVFGEASTSGTGGMSSGTGGGVVPLFVLMVVFVLASALGAGAPHTGHSFRSSGN